MISGAESLSLLCEVLSALGNTKPGVLKPILPDICHAMASVAQSSLGGDDDLMEGKMRKEGEGGDAAKTRVLTLLAAMLFQTLKGHRWTPDAEQVWTKSPPIVIKINWFFNALCISFTLYLAGSL